MSHCVKLLIVSIVLAMETINNRDETGFLIQIVLLVTCLVVAVMSGVFDNERL